MTKPVGLNEYGPLRRVALRHVREAFGGPAAIAASWRDLNYLAAPDYGRALADYDRAIELEPGEVEYVHDRGHVK